MKRNLEFWSGAFAFLIIYTLMLSYVQTKDMEAAEAESFGNGLAQGVAIEQNINKARNQNTALQWWVGSNEMEEVRNRLCQNYNRPKVK